VRSPEALRAAIGDGRRAGASVFVCDAETDEDIARALTVLLERARPLVLAGSLGLGRAFRRAVGPAAAEPPRGVTRPRAAGALVVVGSAHPVARAQAGAIAEGALVCEVGMNGPGAPGVPALAACLARGGVAVLRTPARACDAPAESLLAAMCAAVQSCVAACAPSAIVLVGGETAHAVLAALGQQWIRVVHEVAPLVVGGELLAGMLARVPIVTKGGSSSDAGAIVRAIEWTQRRAA
jgi:uncharacterized protein YgbK (DUF1537 family)